MNLETERLILRNLEERDVPAVIAIWTDPDVTRYMGGPRDSDRLRTSILEDLPAINDEPYTLRPVVARADGTVVGHCGLLEKEIDGNREIELVYVLAKNAWDRGYATEIGAALRDDAFRRLGVRRLIAIIDPENTASVAVAQRLGFTYARDIDRIDPVGVRHRKQLYLCEASASTPSSHGT